MKRSSMSRGTKPMKRGNKPLKTTKPLKATRALKSKSQLKSTGKIKTIGKKTQAWTDARNELKIEFELMGITSCELGYEGCWRTKALGFAHAKKRNDLLEGELKIVALLCNICHDKIEGKPDMEQIVLDVINERNRRLKRFKRI